jgi:hypothetical protein
MTDRAPGRGRVTRQLIGEPITVGKRTIQPVARVAGWYGSSSDETAGGVGAWLRVSPSEVIVRERDGSEHHVPITDPTREAVQGLMRFAFLVAALCWLIMLVLRWRRAQVEDARQSVEKET